MARKKRYRLGTIARELDIDIKDLVWLIKDRLGIEVKDGRSTVSQEVYYQLFELLEGVRPDGSPTSEQSITERVDKVKAGKEEHKETELREAEQEKIERKVEPERTERRVETRETVKRDVEHERFERGTRKTEKVSDRVEVTGRLPRGEFGDTRKTVEREGKSRARVTEADRKEVKVREEFKPREVKEKREEKAELRIERERELETEVKEEEAVKKEPEPEEQEIREVEVSYPITVGAFAKAIGVPVQQVLKKLLERGHLLNVNSDIPRELAEDIALDYSIILNFVEAKVELPPEEEEVILVERPPIVTVMGHVDHGKTTLLDAIQRTAIAEREYGGITQHIGAYQVEVNGRKITFIDTPGHEAFTTLRARGAQVTDIAVLVVAADDGVMPQTIEAINHARDAGVEIIVAINKIDKPNANIDMVKNQLAQLGLIPEEWGGKTIMVPISAKKRQNIDELLEMILLLADMMELKANIAGRARGVVIESRLSMGRGPVATVIVQKGILRLGDPIVIGRVWGKVRAMIDARGRRLKEAGPSTPVEILGLSDVPNAGDKFVVVDSDREARRLAEEADRIERRKKLEASKRIITLEDISRRIAEGEVKELKIVVKADTQGSLEAIRNIVERIGTEEVKAKIIHSAIGNVTESDVMLASASKAIVIAFNVKVEPSAKKRAESEGVQIRTYKVIFELIDDIRSALEGLLEPEIVEVELGEAIIKQVFKISRVGKIAGCLVTRGKVTRNARVRLLRDQNIIWEGEIESLKRFKNDVREVQEGYECGIKLKNWDDIKEGDIIIAYTMESRKRKLG